MGGKAPPEDGPRYEEGRECHLSRQTHARTLLKTWWLAPATTKAYPWLSCRQALAQHYKTNEYPVLAEHGLCWCQAHLGPENDKLVLEQVEENGRREERPGKVGG